LQDSGQDPRRVPITLLEVPLDDTCHDLDPAVEARDHQPVTDDDGERALGGYGGAVARTRRHQYGAGVATGHEGEGQADSKCGEDRDDHTLLA
jgi:hypothetical protein